MLKKLKYIFIFLIIFGLLALFSYKWAEGLVYSPKIIEKDTLRVEIPTGTSIYSLVKIFNSSGFLEPDWFFKHAIKYYSQFSGKTIFAGYYQFADTTSNFEIIKSLFTGGRIKSVRVTFPEGISLQDFLPQLHNRVQTDTSGVRKLFRSDSLLRDRNISHGSLLGYIMPETYEIYIYETPENVIDKLLAQAEKFWTEKRLNKLEKLGLTKHEIITLASIIEAETPLKSEARRVSGLYHNRLKKGMLLQADPTIQFMLGEKRRVLFKDLEKDHPYNTYKNVGLPPGPINCPGKDALEAALDPEVHDYLFMVSIGDGSGRHNFARSHAQHLAFVKDYRTVRDSVKKAKKEWKKNQKLQQSL
jgi:peptidoglycan lytic transglycosylase G